MSHTIKITSLPYMGKPAETKAAVARRIESKEINMSSLHKHELAQVNETVNDFSDPYIVLVRKVTHLANLLGTTEDEAERILFARIGA